MEIVRQVVGMLMLSKEEKAMDGRTAEQSEKQARVESLILLTFSTLIAEHLESESVSTANYT